LRNNLGRHAEYEARLLPPPGWQVSSEYASIEIEAAGSGELKLRATAPADADGKRRLMTAEVRIDGVSQGPLAEAIVIVGRSAVGCAS